MNAGCRQAGPKILFDLYSEVSDWCKIYEAGLAPKGGYGIQSLILDMPTKSCYVTRLDCQISNFIR